MRYLVLAIISLLLGAMLAVVAMSALRRETSYSNGVMAVMAAQMKSANGLIKTGQCDGQKIAAPLKTLDALGAQLEPAFFPTPDDQRFSEHAEQFRNDVAAALQQPALNCVDAAQQFDVINATCRRCHGVFKS